MSEQEEQKKNFLTPTPTKAWFVLLMLVQGVIVSSKDVAQASDGYTIYYGQTVAINAHGYCKYVYNTQSPALYVAVTNAAEWISFFSSPGTATVWDCYGGDSSSSCGSSDGGNCGSSG